MRDDCDHLLRPVRHEHVRRFDECAASVGHVVDQDCDAPVDVAHECHARDLVGLRPLLVNQREVEVEAVCERGGTLGTPSIGGDNDSVFVVEVLAYVAESRGLGV